MLRFLSGRRAIAVLLATLSLSLVQRASAEEPVDFNREVRPILSEYCFKCHGIDDKSRKGKLRLDVRETALQPASSDERAIVPGKPDESELVRRILTDDEDEVMPPTSMKKPLSAEQKQKLKTWVSQGANYAPHWAFVPPVQSPLPSVEQADWAKNPIDSFVLAQLEKEGLKPSPAADKYTLIRRVYLDLVGLPPTPEEADAFVNDKSPDAYMKVVDGLLARPQYGERWTRRWMDLARYADTNGYEKDRPRSIWPYRDWVINAINADMPFDQFSIEQLAGDMLPNATVQQKIATGFHRNTMRNEEGGIDPLEFRYYSLVDRVGTTATTWLGMTVACAQCHTHKYDPILHKEYFQMMAFFNNADEPELDLESPETIEKRKEIEAKIAKLTGDLANKWPVDDVQWEIATAARAKVKTATTVKLESSADNSWRAVGPVQLRDTYTFEIDSELATIDRIRVEPLMDGKDGPGRTPHGNFVLSELKLFVTQGDGGEARPVKIGKAETAYSQPQYAIANAFDGKPRTGWAVAGDGQKDRLATFHLAEPLKLAKGGKLTVTLDQQFGDNHTIGRLRLSLGGPKAGDKPKTEERRQELVDAAYKKWLAEQTPKAVEWKVIRPTDLKSSTPTLTLLEDGSILGSGDITKSDTYELAFKTDLKGITAVRIEALPHESLPKNGPGMVYYEGPMGDFCLSELSLDVNGEAQKFGKTAHTYAAGNFESAKAIDGNPQTGWMINGQQGRPNTAVFALEKPTGDAKQLKVKMLFERHFAPALGHFRISVTTDPRALTEPRAVPPELELALLGANSDLGCKAGAVPGYYFLMTAPELAGPRQEIDKLFKSLPEPPSTLVMTPRPAGHERTQLMYKRGEFTQPADAVEPGVPAVLPPLPAGTSPDRLTFARWLVSRDNPLTARVTVNRQWQAFFGRGIVKTTEDFGFQGDMPSHPQLLDWLAVEFMNQGWSMKKLHRLIVTSNTYQQSSAVSAELLSRDPQNVLLARGPRFRIEGEMVRDAALEAAGKLSRKMFGPSVFPPQPASVTSEGAYGRLDWKTSTGEDRYRRSLYTFSKRTAPYAMYGTFDAPSGEACVPRRELSNTPLQALTVLNDEVFVEAAQSLGKLTTQQEGGDEAKAAFVFRRCLTRPPEKDELAMLVKFAATQRERFAAKELDAAKLVNEKEGDVIEHATWMAVARAVLNLDEAVTKD